MKFLIIYLIVVLFHLWHAIGNGKNKIEIVMCNYNSRFTFSSLKWQLSNACTQKKVKILAHLFEMIVTLPPFPLDHKLSLKPTCSIAVDG